MFTLAGKKCIITGANQGIGFAIAKRFLGEGANVCLVGRNAVRVDEAVQKLQSESESGSGPGIRSDPNPDAAESIQRRLHSHVCEDITQQRDWIDLFTKHVSSQPGSPSSRVHDPASRNPDPLTAPSPYPFPIFRAPRFPPTKPTH